MSDYKYPDEDDRLTVTLINEEYDSLAWQKSEERVLALAGKFISEQASETEKRILLDVGCGLGRLFGFFAGFVGRIEALEPDRQRYCMALQEAQRVEKSRGISVSVMNDVLGKNQNDNSYDVILSSHVIQHLGTRQTEELIQTMSQKLKKDGLLILMTTYAHDDQERYFCESWENDRRVNREVTKEEFETVFYLGSELPVRMFAKEAIKEMTADAGLRLVEFRPYHGKQTDCEEKETEEQPRDALYIFTKE